MEHFITKLIFIIHLLTIPCTVTGLVSTPAKAYVDKNCSSKYQQGKAFHKFKNMAGKIAIKNWSTRVAATKGANWVSWRKANNKTIPCTYSKSTQRWGCRAIAKPCSYIRQPKISKYK